ncbi:MAG: hypothetical protein NVSMB13_05440 [Mycobacteriales bacterium]
MVAMIARASARIAWALAGLSTGLALGYVVLLHLDEQRGYHNVNLHWLPTVLWSIAWPVLGAVVLAKHPRNRLAWVFVLIGLGNGTALATRQYAVHTVLVSPGSLPAVRPVEWFGVITSNMFFPLITLVPQLFPDGQPLSPRWRWLRRLTLGLLVTSALVLALRPGRLDPALAVDNPFGLHALRDEGWAGAVSQWVLGPLSAIVIVGAITSLVLRYVRARGVVREQMKFFVLAVVVSVVGLAAEAGYESGWTWVYGGLLPAFVISALVALVAPVAFGLAITRHGLYDIDRVISRTVSYAVITGLLVGVYISLITVVTRLLPTSNAVAVAGSTLAVAALFQPVRRRVQGAVDRRFNRARYDAARTVEQFSARLREEIDLASLSADLVRTVHETFEPTQVSLWIPAATVSQPSPLPSR